MDECDVTDARMEAEEKLRVDKHRKMMESKIVEDDCAECGMFIPIARQQATGGTDMCIDCQSIAETKNKTMRN